MDIEITKEISEKFIKVGKCIRCETGYIDETQREILIQKRCVQNWCISCLFYYESGLQLHDAKNGIRPTKRGT